MISGRRWSKRDINVKNEGGQLPFEDATLDMSNPEAVKWYQGKLMPLLKLGVGAIKVDFGEGAPLAGQYHSGLSGWYEHNLYPLRYNKAVAEVTKEVTGDDVIWARSAWAGSQRYPRIGVAMLRTPIQRWRLSCGADSHLVYPASRIGAMTSVVLCSVLRVTFTGAGWYGEF